jgi:hypothetical protein
MWEKNPSKISEIPCYFPVLREFESREWGWSLASTNLKGSEHHAGAALVVALLRVDAVRRLGDHKGRPYYSRQ